MSYQVIARRWRPQSFEELVGQAHISQTLNNAVALNRVPQAVLFTGPRGTGKTTTARIFAKNLRCLNPVNGVACNQCASCLEITNGSSIDVLEIDGASHNGVDAVRQLRETVGYMPASGKYKVYIIDEVHMLSSSAFNALLKTLEEPPPHVIFIFATTEVHKIPDTILSRCQRFDFRRIPLTKVVERLKYISEQEGFETEDEALWLLARQGEGSLRDSLSFLDQVAAFSAKKITLANVTEILGMLDHSLLKDLLEGLITRQPSRVLSLLARLHDGGVDPEVFFEELLYWLRHLIVIKTATGDKPQWLEMSDGDFLFFSSLGAKTSLEDLHMLFDVLLKGEMDLHRAGQPLMVMEVVLLRCLLTPQMANLNELLAHAMSVAPATFSTVTPSSSPSGDTKSALTASAPIKMVPEFVPGATPLERWFHFVEKSKKVDSLYSAKLENLVFISETEKRLILSVPSKLAFLREQFLAPESRKKLQGLIDSFWGAGYAFEIGLGQEERGESVHSSRQKQAKEREVAVMQKIKEHPAVLKAQEVFRTKIASVVDSPNRVAVEKSEPKNADAADAKGMSATKTDSGSAKGQEVGTPKGTGLTGPKGPQ